MNITTRITLASGLSVAVLTIGGATAPASTISAVATVPTTPTVPTVLSSVPAGWTVLVDDSQTIQIAVPPSWSAVDTVASNSGNPRISATTDENAFFADGDEQYSVAGVIYMAVPYNPDTEAVNAEYEAGIATACADGGSAPYDDGVFVGHIHTWTKCAGTPTTIYQIAGNPHDGQFTAALMIQLSGEIDDAATLSALQLSFGRVGTATSVPGSTVPEMPMPLPTTPTAATGAPTSATVGVPTTTTPAHLDPVTSFQEAMASSGLTVTYQEASCWLDSMMQIDTSDMAVVQAAGVACGVQF